MQDITIGYSTPNYTFAAKLRKDGHAYGYVGEGCRSFFAVLGAQSAEDFLADADGQTFCEQILF